MTHQNEPIPAVATSDRRRRCSTGGCFESGQSTVEYALVLLGAAAVALALVAWVTRTDAISRLFDVVIGHVLSSAG